MTRVPGRPVPPPNPVRRAPAPLRLVQSRAGATSIEYGLMAALIAVAILGALTAFSENGTGLFNGSATRISTAING